MSWLSTYGYRILCTGLLENIAPTGTISVIHDSVTVNGSGTNFLSWRIGDKIFLPDSVWYIIADIVSNTVITLISAYTGSTLSGQTYKMMRINYQLELTVYKGTGTNSGSTIYLQNHALSWGGDDIPNDLRFTKIDGMTELKYWVRTPYANPNRVFVRIPELRSDSTDETYVYYGKSSDTTTSSGKDTLDLFDHFGNIDTWIEDSGNPIFQGSGSGWDKDNVADPCVLKEGSVYRMWYNGANTTTGKTQEGYAYSSNRGGPFTRGSNNPVLSCGGAGSFDEIECSKLSVVHKDSTYYGTYIGYAANGHSAIGWATRADSDPSGVWTKGANNPILSATESWEDNFLQGGYLRYCDTHSRWELWYCAGKTAGLNEPKYQCFAYCSGDPSVPANWTKYSGNPLHSPAMNNDWNGQGMGNPKIFNDGGTLYGIYGGFDNDTVKHCREGLVVLTDEVTWSITPQDLVIGLGEAGRWNAKMIYTGTIMKDGATWAMWLNGANASGTEAIGLWTFMTNQAVLDTTKWRWSNKGSGSVGSSVINFDNASATGWILSQVSYPRPYAVMARLTALAGASNGAFLGGYSTFDFINYYYYGFETSWGHHHAIGRYGGGGPIAYSDSAFPSLPVLLEKKLAYHVQKALAAETQYVSTTDLTWDGDPSFPYIGADMLKTASYDWALVRYWATTEPSWGTWGSEELISTGYRLLKEDGYALLKEDTYHILLESAIAGIIKIIDEAIQILETPLRVGRSVRLLTEVTSIVEVSLRRLRSARFVTETLSILESTLKRSGFVKLFAETMSLSETAVRIQGFTKLLAETVGLVEGFVRRARLVKALVEVTSIIEVPLRRFRSIRLPAEVLSITETTLRKGSLVKILAEVTSIIEVPLRRFRSIRLLPESISIVEIVLRKGRLVKLFGETIHITESVVSVLKFTIVKLLTEVVNVAETFGTRSRSVRVLVESISILDSTVVTGFLRIVALTVKMLSRSAILKLHPRSFIAKLRL